MLFTTAEVKPEEGLEKPNMGTKWSDLPLLLAVTHIIQIETHLSGRAACRGFTAGGRSYLRIRNVFGKNGKKYTFLLLVLHLNTSHTGQL